MVLETDRETWQRDYGLKQRARSNDQGPYIEQCWSRYLQYIKEQNFLKKDRQYGVIEIAAALERLPNVQIVNMDYGFGLSGTPRPWRRSLYRGKKPFKDALVNAGPELDGAAPGVSEMKALISAIHVADIKLECLRLGSVHWTCMKDAFLLDAMEHIIPSLTTLELRIGTAIDQETKECGAKIVDYLDFMFEVRWLERLPSLAPSLVSLSVSFDWQDPAIPASLEELSTFLATCCYVQNFLKAVNSLATVRKASMRLYTASQEPH